MRWGLFLFLVLSLPVQAVELTRAVVLDSTQSDPKRLRPYESLTAPDGANLIFEEGSVVRLGRGADFRFTGERTLEVLRGAAWIYSPPNNGGLLVEVAGVRAEAPGGSLITILREDGTVQIIALTRDPRGLLKVTVPGRPVRFLDAGQVLTLTADPTFPKPQFADLAGLFKSELFTGLFGPQPPAPAQNLSPALRAALTPAFGELGQSLAYQEDLFRRGILQRTAK